MGRRARVLVAEDDAAMRDLIASDLRREGYEVVVAGSAEELFARIGRIAVRGGGSPESIAVIISDIRMPGLSGMDVLSAVRGASWRTPVILITAFGSEEIHREAAELGARAVLDKPFTMERLRDLVRQTVNRC
jgi:DNA-binding response OmpR family regulator